MSRGGAAGRLYGVLLRLYPRDFRRRWASEMQLLFLERLRDAREAAGLVGVARLWVWTLKDTVANALAERLFGEGARPDADGSRMEFERRVERRGGGGMDSLMKDIRYAVRTLRRNPGFTLVAALTIGLGIGANTAIFSVVRGVLLRPLPYEEPDRLALVWGQLRNRNVMHFAQSPPQLRDLRQQSEQFEDFAGVVTFSQALTGEGEPVQVQMGGVTTNFFELLGVRPVLGRDFVEEDGLAGGDAAGEGGPLAFNPPTAAILSHELWQTHFGGDPSVIGRTIRLSGNSVEVVGVLPAGFELHMPPESNTAAHVDLWTAQRVNIDAWPSRANALWEVIGRLKPGVTVPQAQAEMDRVAEGLRDMEPIFQTAGYALEVAPMQEDLTEHVRPVVLSLLGAVGFLLLIACANVSNLLLVRASGREREIAIRAAVGGSRGRIMRQLFVESGLLALLGAVLGLALAEGGIRLLLVLQPDGLPRLDTIGIDGAVLGFTAGATVLAALIFGAIPAVQSVKTQLVDALRDRGRSAGLAGQKRLRNAVVVGEVALSLVLLIGAGLMLRSFVSLQQVDPGFDAERVLTFELSLPQARYPTPQDRNLFLVQLQERLEALPGVETVSAAFPLPLEGIDFNGRYGTEAALADESEFQQAGYRIVLPGYFDAMGTRRIAGRTFTPADNADSAAVVVVDELLAEKLWPDESAVGQRLLVRLTGVEPQWVDVIGVVEHQRAETLAEDGRETIYFTDRYAGSFGNISWAVRASVPPLSVVAQARSTIRELDPLLPVADVRTMQGYVRDAMASTRFALVLIGIFGVIALVLAAVGLYGVLAYVVRQRTSEIGIRMAFGARTRGILWMVVKQGLALALVGVGIGLVAAFGLTRLMSSLLVGVQATDPATFAGIALFFVAVAAIAALVPAHRASRVSPVVALKEE